MLSEYISIICTNTCYFWILHLIFGQLSLFKLSMKINPLNNGEISTILQQVVITLKGLKGTRMKLFWNQLLDFISAKYMFVQMLFSFASHKKRFLLSFYQRASAVSFGSLFSDWWLTAMHWPPSENPHLPTTTFPNMRSKQIRHSDLYGGWVCGVGGK